MRERFLKSTYFSKGTDFSASDFTKPLYQIWVSRHFEVESSEYVSFKSAIGSAFHAACEQQETSVIKEFSHIEHFEGVSIGGTADLLEYDYELGKFVLGDHKTKGAYSAKKFLGFTRPITKTRKVPEVVPPEQDKEIMQLSIYKWLFKNLFNIHNKATIYLWVVGHTQAEKRYNIPEYTEVELELLSDRAVEHRIKKVIEVAASDTPPPKDCEEFLCNYCEYKDVCPFLKAQSSGGFSDLS